MISCNKCTLPKPAGAFRPGRRQCLECEAKAKRDQRAGKRVPRRIDDIVFKELVTTDSVSERDYLLEDEISAAGRQLLAVGNTDRFETACVESILAHGSITAAAAELGIEPDTLRTSLVAVQRRAATRGYSPGNDMTKLTAPGFHVKGTSTLYDAEGNITSQWVKTKVDESDRISALLDAFAQIKASIPVSDPVALTTSADAFDDDLLAVYPMGDPHLGMMAWPAETGNKFDLAIAERNLYAAVDSLVSLAPPARYALVLNCGDFFHSDGKGNTTTAGTPVDVDGRWPKVLATGIRLMRRIIDRALEKHEHVTVINEIGNHDDHTSIMLALCLAQFYENNPRVHVDTSPEPFHWYRFGKVLIGTHHGDKAKRADLLGIMATDQRQAWGESEFCYWYLGHVHHDTVKEMHGLKIESFRTLAGKDAWHHAKGYRAMQDMKCIIHHRNYGEINRHTISLAQIAPSED